MKQKTLLTIASALIVFGAALAAPADYNVSMKVFPEIAHESNNVLVTGYIKLSDWGRANDFSDMSLRLLKNGEIEAEYSSNDIMYQNDINNSDLLLDGFFYKDLGELSDGEYVIQLRIAGKMVDYKRFNVLNGTSNLTMDFIDVAQSRENIKLLVDLHNDDQSPLTVNLSIYGRKNFDNPIIIENINLNPQETYHLPEASDTFDITDFADENQVFGLILYASSQSQNGSPAAIILNRGFNTAAYTAKLSGTINSIKLNEAKSFELEIKNEGLLKTTYAVSLEGDLSSYAQLSAETITLAPGEEGNFNVTLTLPKDYAGGNELKVVVSHESSEAASKTFKPTLLPADKEHKVSIAEVSYDAEQFFKGQEISGHVSIQNSGDYYELLKIYFTYNGETLKKDAAINPGETKNVTFVFNAGDATSLHIDAYNNDTSAEFDSAVPIAEKNYSFSAELSTHEIISQDKDVEQVNLTVKNTGNSPDYYRIRLQGHDQYMIDKEIFLLNPGENKTVLVSINIPSDEEELNVTVNVKSELGNITKGEDLLIHIFKTISKTNKAPTINASEASIQTKPGEGVVYSIAITNNKLITRRFTLNASSSDFNGTISVYPSDGITVQPGETKNIYIYATPEANGNFSIDYTVYEEGEEAESNTLSLKVSEEEGISGLTGYIVAAGGIFGVAGLIILIIFIYVYFLRNPPKEGEDEFKPVEVKKAELGKPKTRTEGEKYW